MPPGRLPSKLPGSLPGRLIGRFAAVLPEIIIGTLPGLGRFPCPGKGPGRMASRSVSGIVSESFPESEGRGILERIPATATFLEQEHPGQDVIKNQTYRKGLQRAPLVGASGPGIVLSHCQVQH